MKAKFRVWDKLNNRMIYPENSDCAVWIDEDGWCLLSHFAGKLEEVIPMNKEWDHLMQCTNACDVNGKLIYEGDIVIRNNWNDNLYPDQEKLISSVVYNSDWHGFYAKDEQGGVEGEELWDWNTMEVIGNIYENQRKNTWNKVTMGGGM